MATLYLDVKQGDAVTVGPAKVTVEKRSGRRVRLKIEADKSVPVRADKTGR